MNTRSAWIFLKGKSWYVGWREQNGARKEKSFGSKAGAKTAANNWAKVKSSELIQGISDGYSVKSWDTFVEEFSARKASRLKPASLENYNLAFSHFSRVAKPKTVSSITTAMVDQYVSSRLSERGKKLGSKTSAATVNKELRALKRILRVAHQWKLLKEVPRIEFVREPKVAPTFVTPEQFALLYGACDAATKPELPNVSAADWWRAYLVFVYLTGWRANEPLKLLREDLDLGAGYAITRAGDNKGGEEVRIPLHPMIVEHLEIIKGFGREVFPWPHGEKLLWVELHKIQAKSGVKRICRKSHEHNEACEWFGLHDLRRAFATENANALSASQLQTMMRHSSYATTQKYINMAAQVQRIDVVSRLSTPNLKKVAE